MPIFKCPGIRITHTKKKCPRAKIWSGENSQAGFAGEHKQNNHKDAVLEGNVSEANVPKHRSNILVAHKYWWPTKKKCPRT